MGAEICYVQGDLLKAPAEALVNTVNTVGVMGKGVALQFKQAFPDNYHAYKAACERGEVRIGRIFVFDRGPFAQPRYILNFPTKKHWRHPSRVEYIQEGLEDLVRLVREYGIRFLALPPLGAGNGGLDWQVVKPLVEEALRPLEGLKVWVYEPQAKLRVTAPSGKKPRLTVARAALLELFALYGALGEPIGRLEAQKLAYFLQEAGLDLRLSFVPQRYGPYAEALNHVLQHLEGHYLRGYGDRASPSGMVLLPGVLEEADQLLRGHPEVRDAVQRAWKLVQGFDSAYGLELLATVHWVLTREGARTPEDVLDVVRKWEGKAARFKEAHLRAAYHHLLLQQGVIRNLPNAPSQEEAQVPPDPEALPPPGG